MKKSTKIISLVLAVVLACSLMTCAIAAEKTESENPIVSMLVAKLAVNAAGNAYENAFEIGGENVGNYYANIGRKFADEVDAWADGKGAETGLSGLMKLVGQLVSDTTNGQKVEAAAMGSTAPVDAAAANDTDEAIASGLSLNAQSVKEFVTNAAKIGFGALMLEIIY